MPDGNFQDYVVLSQDTLSHRGVTLAIGTTSATTAQLVLSNSAGALALAGAATANATAWLPSAGGTLLTAANLSAGTTSQNLSAVTFSNANGVSFGLQGSTITASAAAGADINLSAGTTSNLATAFTFANGNNVSFGLNGSTITASVSGLASLNVSAGTTSENLSALTFSYINSMGTGNLSFGLSGSTLTALVAGKVAPNFIELAAGTQTADYGEVFLANSNVVSWGLSGSSQVTASTFTQAGEITALNVSAAGAAGVGATSTNVSALTFANTYNGGNLLGWGLNGSTLTASAQFNVSAGTTSQNLTAVTFSNSNGVSFGLNGSTVTASAGLAVSAGPASGAMSKLVLSNSNGLSFGLNGSVVTVANGGISSWQNGNIFNSFTISTQNNHSILPVVIDYGITVTNFVFLLNIQGITSSSGNIDFNVFVYTLANSTLLTAVSTTNSLFTWTSGAAYSSVSSVNYHSVSVGSWAFTPGFYAFGLGMSYNAVGVSASVYGIMSNVGLAPQLGANSLILPGFVTGTLAASASIAVTNTAGYIRNGSSVFNQPWFAMQGT